MLGKVIFSSFLILSLLATTPLKAGPIDLALKHFDQGRYKQALSELELVADKTNAEHTYYLGRSYFKDGQISKARDLFLANLERHPLHANSHFLLGSVTLISIADVNVFKKFSLAKKALAYWQRAAELSKNNVEIIYGLAIYYLNAPSLVGGDPEKAKQAHNKLALLNPAYSDLVEATIARKSDNKKKAEALLISAIEKIPERAFPTFLLANFYLDEERYEEALSQLQEYRKRSKTWNDPGLAQASILAGRIYIGLGNTDKARQELISVESTITTDSLKKYARKELKKLN